MRDRADGAVAEITEVAKVAEVSEEPVLMLCKPRKYERLRRSCYGEWPECTASELQQLLSYHRSVGRDDRPDRPYGEYT